MSVCFLNKWTVCLFCTLGVVTSLWQVYFMPEWVYVCVSLCQQGQNQPSSFTALQITLITLRLRNVPAFFPLLWWCFKMWTSESAVGTDRKRSDGQNEAARVSGAHVEAVTADLWFRFMGDSVSAVPFNPCNYNSNIFPKHFSTLNLRNLAFNHSNPPIFLNVYFMVIYHPC